MGNRVAAAVAALAELRRSGRVVDALPDGAAPQDLGEAYAVQDGLMSELGLPVGAWKVGATAPAVQKLLGVDGPFAGPVFSATVVMSPADVPAKEYHHRQIECEFAFVCAEDLSPRSAGYTWSDIEAVLTSIVPAVELISPRFTKVMPLPPFSAIADCGLNAGLVLGKPFDDLGALDLVSHQVILRVDGSEVARGSGANVLGDPIEALLWLVNHLSDRGVTLPAGTPVSTGTMTGLTPLEPGQKAVADFGVLGEVSVTFV